MEDKFREQTKVVLLEMCKRVGADYDKIDFKKLNWFWEHRWTQEQEDDFIKWLSSYLLKNKDARNALMQFPDKAKKRTREFAESFVYNYGWKVKETNENRH